MGRLKKQATSVLKLLRSNGPEKDVPKTWLARSAGRLDRRFATSAPYSIAAYEDYLRIEIDNQIFLWPKSTQRSAALQILSEVLTPMHPHQYLYGHTMIGREDIVLDIGACEGAFSAVVTSQCSQVIAVEPSRTMCSMIPVLFRLRNEPCPLILNCLLGEEPGTAFFLEDCDNPGRSMIAPEPVKGAYEVPVRTLDQIAEELEHKPTFIKCDAEGAEPAIFRGGQQFLRKNRPKLAITTYHNDSDYEIMHKLLSSLGYKVAGKGFHFNGEVLRVQMIHAW